MKDNQAKAVSFQITLYTLSEIVVTGNGGVAGFPTLLGLAITMAITDRSYELKTLLIIYLICS